MQNQISYPWYLPRTAGLILRANCDILTIQWNLTVSRDVWASSCCSHPPWCPGGAALFIISWLALRMFTLFNSGCREPVSGLRAFNTSSFHDGSKLITAPSNPPSMPDLLPNTHVQRPLLILLLELSNTSFQSFIQADHWADAKHSPLVTQCCIVWAQPCL